MAGLGMHLAIGEDVVARLLAADDDAAVIALVEEIEERSEPGFSFGTDQAWDPLHRCLTDGTLSVAAGSFPLSHAVLGGVQLCEDPEYLVSLVRADQVSAVADALAPVDAAWLRRRYDALEFPGYGRVRGAEDFAYLWANVAGIAAFYEAAAQDGRTVIFSVEL
jgi:hypothetical protein